MFQYKLLGFTRSDRVKVQFYCDGRPICEVQAFAVRPLAEFEEELGRYLYNQLVVLGRMEMRAGRRCVLKEIT